MYALHRLEEKCMELDREIFLAGHAIDKPDIQLLQQRMTCLQQVQDAQQQYERCQTSIRTLEESVRSMEQTTAAVPKNKKHHNQVSVYCSQ